MFLCGCFRGAQKEKAMLREMDKLKARKRGLLVYLERKAVVDKCDEERNAVRERVRNLDKVSVDEVAPSLGEWYRSGLP